MVSEKYEVEFVSREQGFGHDCYAMLSMLTGYTPTELYHKLPTELFNRAWWGRDFAQSFRTLGYDCSPKFKKFDPATPYPCLLRFGPTKREIVRRKQAGEKHPDFWDCYVYYDGLVYSPDEDCVYPLTLFNPVHKITSMMQVWISDL